MFIFSQLTDDDFTDKNTINVTRDHLLSTSTVGRYASIVSVQLFLLKHCSYWSAIIMVIFKKLDAAGTEKNTHATSKMTV